MEDGWSGMVSEHVGAITGRLSMNDGSVNLCDRDQHKDAVGSGCGLRSRANTWPVNYGENDGQEEQECDPRVLPTLPEEDTGETSSSAENLPRLSPSNTQSAKQSPSSPPVKSNSKRKRNSARRNPWGNMSYADLIENAISSAPDKRLVLSEIYDWLVENVSYFKEKADSNKSAGWKNSVRHNLSLHSRFMRLQNETGTGKSSWWTVNESARFEKPCRRRAATLEPKEYEKRNGRLKKTVSHDRCTGGEFQRNFSPVVSSYGSPCRHPEVSDFRSRTDSSTSSYGCVSPRSPTPDDYFSGALSPRPWSTYDSMSATGSASRLRSEFDFSCESDFAGQLAKNVSLNDTRRPSFEHISKVFVGGTPVVSYPSSFNQESFLSSSYGAQRLPESLDRGSTFGSRFATNPEGSRLGHPSSAGFPRQRSSYPNMFAEFDRQSGNRNWVKPHDLESLVEPQQCYSHWGWEELLHHEVAMDPVHTDPEHYSHGTPFALTRANTWGHTNRRMERDPC